MRRVARAEREQPVRRNKPLPGIILYNYFDLYLHYAPYIVNTLTGAIIGVPDQKIHQALSMPKTQYRGQCSVDIDVLSSYILPL